MDFMQKSRICSGWGRVAPVNAVKISQPDSTRRGVDLTNGRGTEKEMETDRRWRGKAKGIGAIPRRGIRWRIPERFPGCVEMNSRQIVKNNRE